MQRLLDVIVTFVETHVGHADELRTKRLSSNEQKIIVRQLAAGVPKDRVIQDARGQVQDAKVQRRNIITKADLAYLMRKFNIDNKRHTNGMTATASKIAEWNKQGENHADEPLTKSCII